MTSVIASAETAEPTPESAEEEHAVRLADLIRVACLAFAALVVGLLANVTNAPASIFIVSGAAVIAVGGWPILHEAGENLLQRRMTMELSMTIALAAALAINQVFVALLIATFVMAAEILESITVARGRQAIQDLLRYLPATALVRRGCDTVELLLAELTVGDIVLVNPGAAIPVDGIVLAGESQVNEASITGEPLPVEKVAGDSVYAGTVNQSGVLELRAERLGRDSTFGKIVEAVEHAERSRAPVQSTADRLAGYLVYFALAAAILTLVLTRNLHSTISVIIVAGACGIAAGTPLAILGGIGRAARQGSIIKGGRYLETLWAVDTVVLDKTGTLTLGTPTVQAVLPANGATLTSILQAAAVAEARSEHPLGRAILAHARREGIAIQEPDHFEYFPGRGVVAVQGATELLVGTRALLSERGIDLAAENTTHPGVSEVLVAREGRLLGALLLADTLRPEAVDAVRALKSMGLRTVLLTGDQQSAAEATARQLGVDEYAGAMLPEDKQKRVRELVASNHIVAMVGDGVNDASALAEASVGVAMGSGTEVTRESAQVVLIGNDLSKFVETLRISRRTKHVIMQNFAGTLVLDSAGMALAAVGLIGPLVAALIHVVSELVFILNSTRLLPAPASKASVKRSK